MFGIMNTCDHLISITGSKTFQLAMGWLTVYGVHLIEKVLFSAPIFYNHMGDTPLTQLNI